MNPTKIWANLAVSDLERTTQFYTRLGFTPNGRSSDLTSFLFGGHNFIIHFFLDEKLKEGIKGALADLSKGNEVVFTLGAHSRQEVDTWAQEITDAGGELISEPEEFGKGYYGFVFTDPDGHRFNVFYMESL